MTGRPPLNVEYKEMVSITKNFTRKNIRISLGSRVHKVVFGPLFTLKVSIAGLLPTMLMIPK